MFSINLQSRQPIYEQLYQSVIKLTSLELLKPNDQLPPVRTLAFQLGINPNTVSKAYSLLERDGIIYSSVGKGSFIKENIPVANQRKKLALDELKKALETCAVAGITKSEAEALADEIFLTRGADND